MLPFQKLVDNFEAQYDLVSNDGSVFTFQTNTKTSWGNVFASFGVAPAPVQIIKWGHSFFKYIFSFPMQPKWVSSAASLSKNKTVVNSTGTCCPQKTPKLETAVTPWDLLWASVAWALLRVLLPLFSSRNILARKSRSNILWNNALVSSGTKETTTKTIFPGLCFYGTTTS